VAVLRHDVDRRPRFALRCAELAAQVAVRGTFYFRYPYTFDPRIMLAIASLGHEIGYHYEVVSKARGRLPLALELFERELAEFRRLCPVVTACMHGSPLSRWDNRLIWTMRTPADFGLVGEPYLSVNFSQVGYYTDTGRAWNHTGASIRDRVSGPVHSPRPRSTADLVTRLAANGLPDRVMITLHPERWHDHRVLGITDLVWQRCKNAVKRVVVMVRRQPAR
jgi:hypothetical protein